MGSRCFFDQNGILPIRQTFVNMVWFNARIMPREMMVTVTTILSRVDWVQRHAAGDTLPVIYAGMFIILLLRKIQVWQNGTQIVIIDNRSWTECSK